MINLNITALSVKEAVVRVGDQTFVFQHAILI